jgi:hypothetical protein
VNPIVASQQRLDRAADCAPCTTSNMTLKEQMAKLGNTELVDENKDNLDKTSNNESIA